MPLFNLGRIVGTSGAMAETTNQFRIECLRRHAKGDWGVVKDEDKANNDKAVDIGGRIMSVYPLNRTGRFLVITEADRSVTTMLLPGDY